MPCVNHTQRVAPYSAQHQLDSLVLSLYEVLRQNLLGVYLHGSLAMGCFRPETSDIDLLAITQEAMGADAHHAVLTTLLAGSNAPHPVEISIVHYTQITPWRHPAPFDLHYSETHRVRVIEMLANPNPAPFQGGVDADLAAHFTVLQRRGLWLAGAPIDALKIEVPWCDYIDSLRDDFAWAQVGSNASLMYAVLNACRTLAAVEEQLVLSKAEGVIWAIPHTPAHLRHVLEVAAARNAGTERELPDVAGKLFLKWVRNRLGW